MSPIKYDKPVRDFIKELSATGHVTHTKSKKKSVTIHHNAGRLSHQGVLDVWKVRPASAHFDVDGNGAVAQYVEANEFAWATGSRTGNSESISIEMCNQTLAPDWLVSEKTWREAARLAGFLFATEIEGKPRPSSTNFHMHSYWNSTVCAGPAIKQVFPLMLAEAQKSYDSFVKMGAVKKPVESTPKPPSKPVESTSKAPSKSTLKPTAVVAKEVVDGKWGNGEERRVKLAKAGYNPSTVQDEVDSLMGHNKRKSISTLAREVIDGKWGSGLDRKNRITKAGYSYQVVQHEVNRLLSK